MTATKEEKKRTIQGRVVSSAMDKTIVVRVETKKRHPLYGKFVSHSNKHVAHDPENRCKEGDIVTIFQCRPISKRKCWQLHEIVESVA